MILNMKKILLLTIWLALLLNLPATGPAQEPPAAAIFNVRSYGAVSDGKTKCTEAIARTIAAAAALNGGTVYFPPGTYLTGPIHLQSHITLYLEAGATVRFSDKFDDYLPAVQSRWEGIEVENFSPLIYIDGGEDIAIRGRGRLDGQGAHWWNMIREVMKKPKPGDNGTPGNKWQQSFLAHNAAIVSSAKYELLDHGFLRPPFVQIRYCTNLLIEGVTFLDSPFWTINPVYCENVTVHAVIINNPASSPNTDGINPDSCRNVHISDCYINSGDDCITIKSGRDADGRRMGRPAENYTIVNCTLAAGHGISVGSEMSGGVRNIAIANCTFDGTDRGIRIKSTRGRGGVIENVRVNNIVMRNITREAILVTTFYTKTDPEPVSERTPVFRDIAFNAITGRAKMAGQFTGLPEMPIRDIRLTDCHLEAETGLKITDASNIELRHVTVDTETGPALAADRVRNLDLDGVSTAQPHANAPVIDLQNISHCYVHGCFAPLGTDAFLRVDAASAGDIVLESAGLSAAKLPLAKPAGIP